METHVGSPLQLARGRDTRERILDAAERLFSRDGFSGTSLRAVTREAGVNLAAVHYHLGSKEALLEAVLARHLEPVNRARLARLAHLEATGTPDAAAVLEALLAPSFDLSVNDGARRELVAIIEGEPLDRVAPLIAKLFGEVMIRFTEALERVAPHLGRDEAYERLQFSLGVMLHQLSGRSRLELVAGLTSPPESGQLDRAVSFLAAGIAAPGARETGRASG
jgi:AcrR family transcriptional regulator